MPVPTNVTPDYKHAEEAFRNAKSVEERIARLEEMITLLPKHKGTDHLYAALKAKLARLKDEAEASPRRPGGGRSGEWIGREGAAQVVMIGPTGSGKSSILRALTRAEPEVGDWPFVTQTMLPGMARFEDVAIQLVDTPGLPSAATPSRPQGAMPHGLLGVVRGADGAMLVVDLSRDAVLDELEAVLAAFEERHVRFVREPDDPQNPDLVRCLVVANKSDSPGASDRLGLLQEMIGSRFEVVSCSCTPRGAETAQGPEGQPLVGSVFDLPAVLFRWLRIVRAYTKAPGRKFERSKPFTVFEGATVEDICRLVHKDFAHRLRFVRLWRGAAKSGVSHEPLTVSKGEPIHDGDVVELHL